MATDPGLVSDQGILLTFPTKGNNYRDYEIISRWWLRCLLWISSAQSLVRSLVPAVPVLTAVDEIDLYFVSAGGLNRWQQDVRQNRDDARDYNEFNQSEIVKDRFPKRRFLHCSVPSTSVLTTYKRNAECFRLQN